ncbi:hypothetical protein GCK32_022177, partial [Trichostrongylus colubriformis]
FQLLRSIFRAWELHFFGRRSSLRQPSTLTNVLPSHKRILICNSYVVARYPTTRLASVKRTRVKLHA